VVYASCTNPLIFLLRPCEPHKVTKVWEKHMFTYEGPKLNDKGDFEDLHKGKKKKFWS
jgi:hypothetical protein